MFNRGCKQATFHRGNQLKSLTAVPVQQRVTGPTFDGIHPTFRQVPPSLPRDSTTAVFIPSWLDLIAATYPPGPPPTTTTSYGPEVDANALRIGSWRTWSAQRYWLDCLLIDNACNGATRNSAYNLKMNEKRNITYTLTEVLIKVVVAQSVQR